jgi:hypothetical protein
MKSYASEVRYSHMEDLRSLASTSYDVGSFTSTFETTVRADLAQARSHHLHDELALALDGYQRLQAVILKTLQPTLLVDVTRYATWQAPLNRELVPTIIGAIAAGLAATPGPIPSFPPGVSGPDPIPDAAFKQLQPFAEVGLGATINAGVGPLVRQAAEAAARGAWRDAGNRYQQALQLAGDDSELRGYLSHDLALVTMRGGNLDGAAKALQDSTRAFEVAKSAAGQVAALTALADVQVRQGNPDAAKDLNSRASKLAAAGGLARVVVPASRSAVGISDDAGGLAVTVTADGGRSDADKLAETAMSAGGTAPSIAGTVELRALSFLDTRPTTQRVTVLGGGGQPVSLALGASGVPSMTGFYEQLRTTPDISALFYQPLPVPVFYLYIVDLYFYVLPMSIGDCLAAMGDFAGAEQQYLAAAGYLYLNPVQMIKTWARLAGLYLDQADLAYRAAGEDLAAIAAVAPLVGRVVAADGTIPDGSPLYATAAFASMTARVQAVLDAADPVTLNDNPELIRLVIRARSRQLQITAKLNFFGFPPDYVPPFSFEYLQNIARYFAQHAATLEQSFIQFKSQAENEEFRREQMEQQVELARASVQLEQRGVDEANAGVAVANASVLYAQQQRANAVSNKQNFDNTRDQLLELAGLEAWANAAAQDGTTRCTRRSADTPITTPATGAAAWWCRTSRRHVR